GGASKSIGISVVARNVTLTDIKVNGVATGVMAGASNLSVNRGTVENCAQAALYIAPTPMSAPDRIQIDQVTFGKGSRFIAREPVELGFSKCDFGDCRNDVQSRLKSSPTFDDCRFPHGC